MRPSYPWPEVAHLDGDGRAGIIRIFIKAPRANAFAVRWVKTIKTECLDWMLIMGPRALYQL